MIVSRFEQLSLRDQAMLALLAGVLLLYIVYMAGWRPLAQSNAQLRVQLQAAGQSLENIGRLAAEYRSLQQRNAQSGGASRGNLAEVIDRSVKAQQLQMSRLQPGSGGDVQVRLDNVAVDRALRWLHQLEHAESVQVRDLSMTIGASTGLVNLSVRLYRP
jgi:general secretion pathway protein M